MLHKLLKMSHNLEQTYFECLQCQFSQLKIRCCEKQDQRISCLRKPYPQICDNFIDIEVEAKILESTFLSRKAQKYVHFYDFLLNFRQTKFRDCCKSIFIQPTIWGQNQNLRLLEAFDPKYQDIS